MEKLNLEEKYELQEVDLAEFENKLKTNYGLSESELETIVSFLDLYEWAIMEQNGLYNIYDLQCGTLRNENYVDLDTIVDELYTRMHDYYLYDRADDFEDTDDNEYIAFYRCIYSDLINIGKKLNCLDNQQEQNIKEIISKMKYNYAKRYTLYAYDISEEEDRAPYGVYDTIKDDFYYDEHGYSPVFYTSAECLEYVDKLNKMEVEKNEIRN